MTTRPSEGKRRVVHLVSNFGRSHACGHIVDSRAYPECCSANINEVTCKRCLKLRPPRREKEMIDEKKIEELRELHHYDTVVIPLLGTLSTSLKVVRAAQAFVLACPCDPANGSCERFCLVEALKPFSPEGK